MTYNFMSASVTTKPCHMSEKKNVIPAVAASPGSSDIAIYERDLKIWWKSRPESSFRKKDSRIQCVLDWAGRNAQLVLRMLKTT